MAHPKTKPNMQAAELPSERFDRICNTDHPLTPSSDPALPGLTPDEARFLTRNADGEVYMTPDAVAASSGELRPAVLSAFRKALVHAFGNDPRAVAAAAALERNCNTDPETNSPPMHGADFAARKRKECADAASMTFAELMGIEKFVPVQELATFSWAESQSRVALEQFNTAVETERKAREVQEEAEAQKAMARAAAAGARSTQQLRAKLPAPTNHFPSYSLDPVVWAAQQESAAAAVLKELRTNLSKMKKGSSKTSSESSPIWALLSQRNSKLKPEAAAEMARAKIAAAAAAAAMREEEPEGNSQRTSVGISNHNNEHSQFDHAIHNFSGLHLTRRPTSALFYEQPDVVSSKNPGFPRALSLDSSVLLKSATKKKRVEFAEGTIFYKRR